MKDEPEDEVKDEATEATEVKSELEDEVKDEATEKSESEEEHTTVIEAVLADLRKSKAKTSLPLRSKGNGKGKNKDASSTLLMDGWDIPIAVQTRWRCGLDADERAELEVYRFGATRSEVEMWLRDYAR